MTDIPGIFAAGNVSVVYDLVDYVSQSGEIAARGAAAYLSGKDRGEKESNEVVAGENVNFVVPEKIRRGEKEEVSFFLRVTKPLKKIKVEVVQNGAVLSIQAASTWSAAGDDLYRQPGGGAGSGYSSGEGGVENG